MSKRTETTFLLDRGRALPGRPRYVGPFASAGEIGTWARLNNLPTGSFRILAATAIDAEASR